ncbi:hypothetical protein [Trichococcus ilyis]|uniref:Uncharacterized protein n=1 Tax=Trichococcus ilyis TaxID=640938 RepID=A0A143Z4A6_9LACT|nr:hypothetical protein [Trichococcus ilyis]CZR06688.1 Hypothetical protein TR210_2344 [Trichococcus ilyis]SEJ85102.1 hypothetical protein SAMN05216375_13122 [Trichococcus ilyis]
MVELDRLVKLLVEKVLRASKKQEPNGKAAGTAEPEEQVNPERLPEESDKEETKKMPEG